MDVMPRSAIIYHNPEETAFLIDIPTSISLAQELFPNQRSSLPDSQKRPEPRRKKQIFSSVPLAEPFPSSTEPKSDAARARVLERIPRSERVFHAEIIEPLVRDGLEVIQRGVLEAGFDWCSSRQILDDVPSAETHLGKRRRAASRDIDNCPVDRPHEFDVDGLDSDSQPPLILSSSGTNAFASVDEIRDVVVKNTSSDAADLSVRCLGDEGTSTAAAEIDSQRQEYDHDHMFTMPPLSAFVLCRLPIAQSAHPRPTDPIPGIPRDRKFNLILFDPPWNNRSVRRGRHYHTQHYSEGDDLTYYLRSVLQAHLYDPFAGNDRKAENSPAVTRSIAAIWITNASKARKTAYDALRGAGLSICEEWAWIKTTTSGEPVTRVDSLWRKPYEILVIGKKIGPDDTRSQRRDPVRRVIAAVPDVHSRKPNLKEVFERMFFGDCTGHSHAALEVFARNLTAGWWACGDEVLKFNAREWWTEESTS
ncbi:MT-A70 family [Aspergillus steynii IBT 23096]|uniref:MT-A70 family n=1 Tax=Aspergillus steynii IBT 23096 TaxID=1392250 RepID=A0A2I2GC30_9EURO|nr:MT-A70 family [Aspergillus steynii IBT 23096]PLB50426.1 MT-A70 family [Aspergillus steynii IBT 23096]